MLSCYACVLTFLIGLLILLAVLSIILSSWCLRFHRQRNVMCTAFYSAVGLFEPFPKVDGLVEVLDQIEGVKRKKNRKVD